MVTARRSVRATSPAQRPARPAAGRAAAPKPAATLGTGGVRALDPRDFAPHAADPGSVLELQRVAGNAAVADLVQRAIDVQRKGAAPTTGTPTPTRPTLRPGDGPLPSVAQLQQALNATVPGAGLRITGLFDADTETALKSFQKANPPLRTNGIADAKTWKKLDTLAPRVVRQGSLVVLGPEKGEARGSPDAGTIHPTIKVGSKGPAVEELQQKLNTVPANQVSIWLSTHGKFDKTTKIAVVEFQKSRTPPLKPANGVVGKGTWAALDAVAGPVTVGRESFDWSQRSEGTITGGPSRFTWRLLPDRLQVTVNIKFTGASKHPMVSTWRGQIASVWNSFKLVNKAKGSGPKQLLLDFVVGSGSPADATDQIHKTPKKAKKIPRSDASNWHTGDTDPGLAPHEFGHLIGLQDEYNKAPESYTVLTGEQPAFGEVNAPTDKDGNDVSPEKIATEMRKAVTGNASTRGKRAVAIVRKYSLVQGGFAQRVALAYEKANAGKLLREDWKTGVGYVTVKDSKGSMGNDLAARIPGRFDKAPDEWEVVAPFLYSNRGIMGTMDELSSPSGLSPHDHPVAERHVRHFLQIVQANKPGNWKLERR
jgi:peptidoglycan hydrolase-like protein with peptidoglycan-binding domain